MIYANAGDLKDPLKQDLAHEFCWNKNKDFSILNKSYINHDQINHIRNNWLGNNFSLLADSHTKDLLFLLHPGLESVTEVDTDPKQRFVSFNPLEDWGEDPNTSFSPATSTNVGISPLNFLTFSFNLFATLVWNFKFYLLPVANYWTWTIDQLSKKACFLVKSL